MHHLPKARRKPVSEQRWESINFVLELNLLPYLSQKQKDLGNSTPRYRKKHITALCYPEVTSIPQNEPP